MDDDTQVRYAALKRKRAALADSGADEAKLNEVDSALAGLKAAPSLPEGPRLIPSPESEVAKEAPAKAEPRPQSRRGSASEDKSKSK